MWFISERTFSFSNETENWTLSNVTYADKIISLFFGYLKKLERWTKLLHMDKLQVH